MTEEGENMLAQWIEQVAASKEEISKMDPKDRLAIASAITQLHTALVSSLKGWAAWLGNLPTVDQLSEEELKETFEVYRKLTIEFLDLDLKMSKSMLTKQIKKIIPKAKKEHKYVA